MARHHKFPLPVEFGRKIMQKQISEYLLRYLPMTPDDKEAFVKEINKKIK